MTAPPLAIESDEALVRTVCGRSMLPYTPKNASLLVSKPLISAFTV